MYKNKKILITGGTGTLGTILTKKLLKTDVEVIRIYSRDEQKQVKMQNSLDDKRLRFIIGDIRDQSRLQRALEDIDMVFHTAALKHVPVAEYNPFEAVKTNIYGSQNLIESCLDKNVECVIAIGTDKAVSPFNTYGATKLVMERLFVAANYYKGNHKTRFISVRYGNVLGSNGSIVPTLVNQIRNKEKITITDPLMTRFNITMDEAVELIFRAEKNGKGGEIFIPKLNAYKVGDMKDAIMEIMKANNQTRKIQIRPGEKFHETLINHDEIRNTFETDMDYVVIEEKLQTDKKQLKKFRKTKIKSQYSSDNAKLLKKNEIIKILRAEKLI